MVEKMTKYNLAYMGLKSTVYEKRNFIDGLTKLLNVPDWIDGFQRGLIVIRDIKDQKINDAYSVTGFFVNYDGEAGDILFERESKIWSAVEVQRKLRTGKVLETIVELNESNNVIFSDKNKLQDSEEYISPEKYFFENLNAFSKLRSRQIKSEEIYSEVLKSYYSFGRLHI
jgi:hypothetical protein